MLRNTPFVHVIDDMRRTREVNRAMLPQLCSWFVFFKHFKPSNPVFSLAGLKNRRDLFVSLKTGHFSNITCCTRSSLPVIFSHATSNWIICGDTISQCTIHSAKAIFVGDVGLLCPRNKKQKQHATKNVIRVFHVLRQNLKGRCTTW